MKSTWLVVSSSLLLASFGAHAKSAQELTQAGTPEQKGLAIAHELASRNAGYKDFAGKVEMVLRDRGGSEAKRSFSVKILEQPEADAGDWSLVVFDAPADVKGTAVLSHPKKSAEDDQWLYLPSARRVKRIAAANRTGSFAGSEFSFEDLTASDAAKFDWKLLGQAACGPLTCFTLEAKPKDAASGYSRRVLHVDTSELRIQSVEYFDRRGTALKTLSYADWTKLEDRFWRAKTWSMQNAQTGKSTVIRFDKMALGNGLAAGDFSPSKLDK